MRKLVIGVAAIVGLLIVAAIIVPRLVSADFYRARIAGAAQAATGRQVRIDGPVSLTILPSLAIEASNVSVANAPGGVAKDMVVLGKLQVGLRLFPLIGGDIEIERFVLTDPVIHLEIDKNGQANWDFSPTAAAPPANPAPAAGQPDTKVSVDLQQLQLGEVKIVNGLIDYADARTNEKQEFSQVGVTVKLPSLDEPSSVEGGVTWRGKAVKLTVSADRPRVFSGSGTGAVKAKLSSDPVSVSLDGIATGGAALKFVGSAQLDIPSVRDLAAWTGNAIAAGGAGFGALSFKGKLDVAGPQIAMTEMALSFDAIKAKGSLSVDTGAARPAIKGALTIDALDLNPYLAQPGKAATPKAPAAPAAPASAPTEGWSDAPMDFTALKSADLSIAAAADSIRYEKIEIGKSGLTVALQNGRLTADLTQLALYGGSGKGQIVLDATQPVPALDVNFTLSGIDAGPLLTAAIDFDRLTGTGALEFALSSHGRSQRELVGALSGKGNFAFTKGTIKGINLPAMLQNAATSFIDSGAGGSDKTDFSELSGSFTVADGIAKNSDLALKSSAIQASGAGTIDLPHRTLSYRVEPNLSLPVAGSNVASLAVPVIIDGPWAKLSYRPDLKGLVTQNTGKLLKGITGTVVPGGKPGGILKGIFGGK